VTKRILTYTFKLLKKADTKIYQLRVVCFFRDLKVVNFTTAEMPNCQYNKDFKIVRHAEINHKCCKNVVKADLPLANNCYIRVSKTATIEWE
jgi:hypothetical protein